MEKNIKYSFSAEELKGLFAVILWSGVDVKVNEINIEGFSERLVGEFINEFSENIEVLSKGRIYSEKGIKFIN